MFWQIGACARTARGRRVLECPEMEGQNYGKNYGLLDCQYY
jgi:hypothetical protein